VVALAACGGGNGVGPHPDGSGGGGSADSGIDAPLPPGWTELVGRTWSLNFGGDEGYRCARIKVPQDMWVSAFRADMATGTHHMFLTLDPNGGTRVGNIDPCDQTTGVDNGQLLYGASVGPMNAADLVFPAGDAVHVAAGSYVMLNMHVFDETDQPMSGMARVLVQTVPQGEVVHELKGAFAGTKNIDIPSDNIVHTSVGTCPTPRSQDYHILAVWPHMHQFGVHAHLTIVPDGTNNTDVVLDKAFTFDDQTNNMVTERVLHANDQLQFTCSYQVPAQTCTYPGGQCNHGSCQSDGLCHVAYGESSVGEMCYAALYMYPPPDVLYGCVNGNPQPL